MSMFIKTTANENGSYDNQTGGGFPGEGWAVVPDDMTIPDSFPFVNITVADGVVSEMTAGVVPTPPEPTASEKREYAYNNEPIVEWDGKMLTVTQAALKWEYYAAEGSSVADELTVLIAAAKAEIRARYPED